MIPDPREANEYYEAACESYRNGVETLASSFLTTPAALASLIYRLARD